MATYSILLADSPALFDAERFRIWIRESREAES